MCSTSNNCTCFQEPVNTLLERELGDGMDDVDEVAVAPPPKKVHIHLPG